MDSNELMEHTKLINVTSFAAKLFYDYSLHLGNECNALISPFSVLILLSAFLISGGPKGGTADQICQVITGSNIICNRGVNTRIRREAVYYMSSLLPDTAKDHTLTKINNAAFIQNSMKLKNSFINGFKLTKNDIITKVNFNSLNEARNIINEWAKLSTNGYINQFYEEGKPTIETLMILLNSIYFEGKWEDPFKPENTQLSQFSLSPSQKIKIPMMYQETSILYYKSRNGFRLIAKNYTNVRFKFVIILPNQDNKLEIVNARIHKGFDWKYYVSRSKITIMNIGLPRFLLKSTVDIKLLLHSMGVTEMFSDTANLTGITTTKLKVNDVRQEVVVEVREEGVRAVARTSILSHSRSAPLEFIVNQPFYCAIYDSKLDLVLFISRVIQPQPIKN